MSERAGHLAKAVGGELRGDRSVEVSEITHDSRQAGPGTLFVAVRGANFNGHEFVGDAVAAGSPVVCVESPGSGAPTEIVVSDTRHAMGRLAAEVFGNPSRSMDVIGVTGTNGKTTVTHFVESIARAAGIRTGLIGTIRTRVGSSDLPTQRTTPEATDFQRLLHHMRELDAGLVAAEVSSHALELGRVSGTRFAVAAFTNLSRDHLDFHGSMQAYREAKERLFTEHEVGTAVINVDDPVGKELAESIELPLVAVGARGDVRAEDVTTSLEGSTFVLAAPEGRSRVEAPVIGRFNVANAVMAGACCLASGISFGDVTAGLGSLPPVPGRFEQVSGDSPVRLIVDYAHTPEGIREAIKVARMAGTGRVIAVVGAGGNRDREKRPLMGAAVSAADIAVITSDNPRDEDPEGIVAEVVTGTTDAGNVIVEIDRRAAIGRAVGEARPGDVVLIMGKGHETGQEVAGEIVPFDDRQVARDALDSSSFAAETKGDSGSMAR